MVGVGLSGCVRVVFLGGDGFALAAFFLVGLSPFCVDNQCVFKYIHHLITFSVSHMLGSHFYPTHWGCGGGCFSVFLFDNN